MTRFLPLEVPVPTPNDGWRCTTHLLPESKAPAIRSERDGVVVIATLEAAQETYPAPHWHLTISEDGAAASDAAVAEVRQIVGCEWIEVEVELDADAPDAEREALGQMRHFVVDASRGAAFGPPGAQA